MMIQLVRSCDDKLEVGHSLERRGHGSLRALLGGGWINLKHTSVIRYCR